MSAIWLLAVLSISALAGVEVSPERARQLIQRRL